MMDVPIFRMLGPRWSKLSTREAQCCLYLCQGYSDEAIAQAMKMTVSAVKKKLFCARLKAQIGVSAREQPRIRLAVELSYDLYPELRLAPKTQAQGAGQ